jgi:hypothetical protein
VQKPCPRLRTTFGGLLLAGAAVVGCQSVVGPAAPTGNVEVSQSALAAQADSAGSTLQPLTTLEWSIGSAQNSATPIAGKSLIGPTGTVELGPYGSVAVAGLTVEQAQAAIQKYVAAYVRGPRVSVRLGGTLTADDEAADRSSLAPDADAITTAGWTAAAPDEPASVANSQRAQTAEAPAAQAVDIVAQAVPSSWRPLPPAGNTTGEPVPTGAWRSLERGNELNAPSEIRSRMRLLPVPSTLATEPLTPPMLPAEAGPELLAKPDPALVPTARQVPIVPPPTRGGATR